MTYLKGAAGQAAYAGAVRKGRKAATRKTEVDPQPASGVEFGHDAPAHRDAMMAACAKCPEGCGAPLAEHHLTDPSDEYPRGHRTYCTRQQGRRRCPCDEYEPVTEGGPDARPD